jgi:asparagine synthase (glutamine-hydrolysing)
LPIAAWRISIRTRAQAGLRVGPASDLGIQVEGVTVAFGEFRSLHEDEKYVAVLVAMHYGLPHHVRNVTMEEFENDIPLILGALDQPSIDGESLVCQ